MAKSRKPAPAPLVASVHRFRDKVGAYIGDKEGTAYLSAAEAREIGEALIRAAASIESEAFTASNVPQLTITAADRR